ncbi:hypothetical protein L3Q82_021079 [Scortum barcoo]|uniref:Uncharacterized protein n=1 Tax=Scortum barcoo TaxID=214431 RepID=A0ACB8X535_9TELE|nr:hypothetical protein L3Q82_021079 [Scortum barcoo]
MLLYFFLLLCHIIGLISGDKISPVGGEVSKREGQSVTSHMLLSLYSGKESKDNTAEYIPNKRYESQTSPTSTTLTIRDLTLADTALYYCALETQ